MFVMVDLDVLLGVELISSVRDLIVFEIKRDMMENELLNWCLTS